LSISFALYFILMNLRVQLRAKRVLTALLALVLAEAFEVFDGFGMLANTHDPVDLIANAVGIGCALGLDTMLSRKSSRHSKA